MTGNYRLLAAVALLSAMLPASAAIVISNDATENVQCVKRHCRTTRFGQGILNAQDLAALLQQGNTSVIAGNTDIIDVEAAVKWSKHSTLTLIGKEFIVVNAPIKAAGSVKIQTGAGPQGLPDLNFGLNGTITFADTSKSALTINNRVFALEKDIAGLAAAIAANPTGNFALANDYDASADGVYAHAPIPHSSAFLIGLNHTIGGLHIDDADADDAVGLFGELDNAYVIDLRLAGVDIRATQAACVGGVVGRNLGGLINIAISGTVVGGGASSAGGLAGCSTGTIESAMSRADVTGNIAGGIIGHDIATLDAIGYLENTFATGTITAIHGNTKPSAAGGLVGWGEGRLYRSYATGHVQSPGLAGGFLGQQGKFVTFQDDYWDTTTSGLSYGCGKVSSACDFGVQGKTTGQLQAGLPDGFALYTWYEDPAINGGLPYLYYLPPRR